MPDSTAHCLAVRSVVAMVAMVAMVAGCAGGPPSAPTAPPMRAEPRHAPPVSLAPERQWLQAWFKGTPVVIAPRADGDVVVEVPLAYCFDAGRSDLKPPLAAVLDKVAESLRRVPQARLVLVAAPADAGGGGAAPGLAVERATRVHRHLQSRGVSAARLAKPGVSGAGAVQLRMEAPPAASL